MFFNDHKYTIVVHIVRVMFVISIDTNYKTIQKELQKSTRIASMPRMFTQMLNTYENRTERRRKKNNVFEMFTFEITHGVNDIETEKGNKTKKTKKKNLKRLKRSVSGMRII